MGNSDNSNKDALASDLMQLLMGKPIGPKDRNDKPICEGDIIRFGEGDDWIGWGVVNYYPDKAAFLHSFQEYFWNEEKGEWEPDEGGWRPAKSFWQNPRMWIEVIGSKYGESK
jgi:hypothetical protein